MNYVHLYNLYAGSGKTYHIIHSLIPSIKHLKFVIISNTHKTLLEYKDYGYGNNCKVVVDHTLQIDYDTKVIIVDEYYQVSISIMEKILQYANCKIYLFGDNRQLPSIDIENSVIKFPNQLLRTFAYVDNGKEWINRRNHFKFDFYDKILNEYDYDNILELINQYSMKNPNDAEYIVAYHNKTLDKYIDKNNKIYYVKGSGLSEKLKKLGLYGDCKIELVFLDEVECHIKFNNEILSITALDYYTYLYQYNLSTIHRLQGKSIKSFYWCKEDNDIFNTKLGRVYCYVLISRLKTKVFPKEFYLNYKINKLKIKLKSK